MDVLGLSSVSTPANTSFTDNYSRTIASQTVNNINFLETINAKSTDYKLSAKDDVLADRSGNNYKTKSAKDVSLAMFLLFTTGVGMWLLYGIKSNAFPVIAANSITLILSAVILYFKYKYRNAA